MTWVQVCAPRTLPYTAAVYGPGTTHNAIANALGITSQELWEAGAAGKSVADLAAERNIPLQKVVDAAVAAYSEQLDGAVTAGTLSQGGRRAETVGTDSHRKQNSRHPTVLADLSRSKHDGRPQHDERIRVWPRSSGHAIEPTAITTRGVMSNITPLS